MEKFLIVLTAPTQHMMFDQPDYFKVYEIECEEVAIPAEVQKKQREFCLEFNVSLADVEHLLTYRIKAQK